ncbi:Gag-pol polyprotein [Merluccius polli]|uniref:Gag-pol polyprotein n=1 Tax=Merluccius polli TaxID=89951 RepID=A0AA47M585_MERPO|nr:Gag-pol polyprotein [Merluccius polli]
MLIDAPHPTIPPPLHQEQVEIFWLKDFRAWAPDQPIQEVYEEWKEYIVSHDDYYEPTDPPHTTLNVLFHPDDTWTDGWRTEMEGTCHMVRYEHLYIGPQGVATHVHLDDKTRQWYALTETSVPHLTLAVARNHEAKDLGPMMKTAMGVTDWTPTTNVRVHTSPSTKIYRISTDAQSLRALARAEKVDVPRIPTTMRPVIRPEERPPDVQQMMSEDTKTSILAFPKPTVVREMLGFLGLTNYSRNYVPDFTERTTLLRAMVTEVGAKNLNTPLVWTTAGEKAFTDLKQALNQATALAAPRYDKPFHLDVHEKNGQVSAILYQVAPTGRHILHYHSAQLDTPERGMPQCARYMAAAAMALVKTESIRMHHPTVIHTTHGVKAAIEVSQFTVTNYLRQTRQDDLLMDPMISYSTEGVNTAEQLTKGNGGAPHNCSQHITEQLRARSDLRASPLKGKDVETWFTDGCCYKDPQGNNIASWAVVRQERNDDHRYDSRPEYATLRHGVLEDRPSAQKAELMAVIQALEMADKLRLNIYTDSNYVYEMAHLNATQAKVREWKTSTGLPVKHQALVQRLLCAIQLPQEVAILKCKGHSKETTSIARGNEAADEAAKLAGGYVQPTASMLTLMPKSSDTQEPSMHEMLADLKTMQSYASDYERNYWLDQGCTLDSIGVYRSKLGKPVLANKTAVMMVKAMHATTHQPTKTMAEMISKNWWFPEMNATIANLIAPCEVCQQMNIRPGFKVPLGRFPQPAQPFEELVIDFTDMGRDNRVGTTGHRYLLVIVDRFSHWGDGRAWIQAFEKATVEDSLCLGTVRAIITRATSASTTRTLCTRLIETTLRKEQFSERVAQMALLQYEGGDNKSDDEDCAVFKDSGLV